MLTIYLSSKIKQTKNLYKHDINQILSFIINANLSFYRIKISGHTQANDGFHNLFVLFECYSEKHGSNFGFRLIKYVANMFLLVGTEMKVKLDLITSFGSNTV